MTLIILVTNRASAENNLPCHANSMPKFGIGVYWPSKYKTTTNCLCRVPVVNINLERRG